MAADSQICQRVIAVSVDVQCCIRSSDTLEQSKEKGSECNGTGFPVTEDHNSQSQEAETSHVSVC